MTFATEIGAEDVATHTLPTEWKAATGRDYQTAVAATPAGYKRAFYVKLPPVTRMHRHVDAGDCESEHLVIKTNSQALNWWQDADGIHSQHMETGKRYLVDRTLEHWATNEGASERVHLILER